VNGGMESTDDIKIATETQKITTKFHKRIIRRKDESTWSMLTTMAKNYLGFGQKIIYGEIGYYDKDHFTGYRIFTDADKNETKMGIIKYYEEDKLKFNYFGNVIGLTPFGYGFVSKPNQPWVPQKVGLFNGFNTIDDKLIYYETEYCSDLRKYIQNTDFFRSIFLDSSKFEVENENPMLKGGQPSTNWKDQVRQQFRYMKQSGHDGRVLIELHTNISQNLKQAEQELYDDLASCMRYQGQDGIVGCHRQIKEDLRLLNMIKLSMCQLAKQQKPVIGNQTSYLVNQYMNL
jgi:hypothetical protein